MTKSVRRATSVLALSAAIMAAGSIETSGGAEAANLRGKAQATQEAGKITREMNIVTNNGTFKVVPVPGILQGVVEVYSSFNKYTESFRNPVILWLSHSLSQIDHNNRLVVGSWIGLPIVNSQGKQMIYPYQLEPGKHPEYVVGKKYFTNTSLHLRHTADVVLQGYGVQLVSSNGGPIPLTGVDLLDSSAPSIPISGQ